MNKKCEHPSCSNPSADGRLQCHDCITNGRTYSACAMIGPEGFACERCKGHSGQHKALGGEECWTEGVK